MKIKIVAIVETSGFDGDILAENLIEEIEKQLFRSDWGLSEFQKFDIMDYQKIKAKWVKP